MIRKVTRRAFTCLTAGSVAMVAHKSFAQTPGDAPAPAPATGPIEAAFERDYDAPSFKPSWKKPQINRQMAQDFVIYAHSDLDKVKMLLDREPGLLNATIDWGAGDWETGLGGASHMGRRDIVEYLLSKGARPDLFCSAMLGQTEVIKALLTLQPTLIDAKGHTALACTCTPKPRRCLQRNTRLSTVDQAVGTKTTAVPKEVIELSQFFCHSIFLSVLHEHHS